MDLPVLQWHNMPLRRRPYQRSLNPAPIRLTHRDKRILETIHAFDGLLSLRQIDRVLLLRQRTKSAHELACVRCFDNGYVQMPDPGSHPQGSAG